MYHSTPGEQGRESWWTTGSDPSEAADPPAENDSVRGGRKVEQGEHISYFYIVYVDEWVSWG